ncbi:Retrovirus-related Pol polyprotein from transposon 17.6 [Vitis vinifera]|uniref:Retrovirus-related Pol polyprotein from transposon 17.6 n=1 Tax=Vitis vinifera TaxID=29760 RepID=A0A438HD52_VITVI|nr:Retrovirus-related Pol polyprotein from transposon 17.6 [Vitis vinifera]
MKLFPLSLKDKAKTWLNSLRPYSIRNWGNLQSVFLQKFFPTHRTSALKKEISNFKAMEDEKFFACWERFKEIVTACPHHGFDNWMLVSYFYEGMSPPMKQLLETMCGGDFMNKNPDEAFQFLDYVAEVSRSWDEPIVKELSRDRTMNRARASGVYTLPEGLDVQAKFATVMRRLDDLEAKGVQEVQIVNEGGHTSNILAILHIPTLIIRVGGIIQIYHGGEVTMASFNSKETDFKVIKLMGNKVFNHKRHKVGDKTLEILEVLKQVKINIPLLDMIKQVPAYAKFLKDLCTAIVKYKDPGCPTISIQIGASFVERALLDLGASVNLLPYSIYKQLGLGELKATTITLSLADRSIKVPKGVVEDVLVQVEKFYYPVDFVVLDTKPLKKGLSFGNMIVEMNVFNLCKQPMGHDDVENEEACFIEALVQEHTEKLMEENIDEFFSTIVKEECVQVATEWKEKYTIQYLNSVEKDEESKKEEVEISKPELKPLPHGLNKATTKKAKSLMQDVVRNEVLKLLDAGIIYPISNSSWVSPTQVVPKKSGITVMKNDEGKLIPTRLTTGWRVCIDFRKLNAVAKKNHFPLPFLDQVLERVAGHDYYCFLDGYSGYFQIAIALEDQDKTTFKCPFGTYAYRRIPFGLCNAPATFQRCMLSIFNDMVERIMEVFMDDLTIYGKTFDDCLLNLKKVLKRCIEKDLVLNWEKCHFMATSRVVLGHIISKEDAEFIWTKACQEAFKRLKLLLTTTPIVRPPNWSLPFELMCDASDYAVGAVLGQREDGKPYVVYYASKTLNDAQKNYTTTENELLAVVFALDKFRNYLLGISIDKQGVENVVADHLSRVKVESHFEEAQINDEFPDDTLCAVDKLPWFTNIENYLPTGELPSEWNMETKKYFLSQAKHY